MTAYYDAKNDGFLDDDGGNCGEYSLKFYKNRSTRLFQQLLLKFCIIMTHMRHTCTEYNELRPIGRNKDNIVNYKIS